jgi:hypothetical protein
MDDDIGAVVSRGGRPDMAGEALSRVVSPTLLIVGGLDYTVIRLNEEAFGKLRCVKELKIVPGATHLFEEPGKLEEVARLAADWFRRRLRAGDDFLNCGQEICGRRGYEKPVTFYRAFTCCRARGRRLWLTRGCANKAVRAGAARRR